ncbi:MAG: hypothetical protein WAK93_08870 [Solirubrobacteraceae bacterium]
MPSPQAAALNRSSLPSVAALTKITRDLRRLWTASTIANRDRKELLRTLITE